MTVLASVAVTKRGHVFSFEPQPDLFAIAQENIALAEKQGPFAPCQIQQSALGDSIGTAQLVIPSHFTANDRIARIGHACHGERTIRVKMTTLDNTINSPKISVMTIDVEGFEANVLRGARNLLAHKRIKHIIFEDHAIAESEAAQILTQNGYEIYSLNWSMRGLLSSQFASKQK